MSSLSSSTILPEVLLMISRLRPFFGVTWAPTTDFHFGCLALGIHSPSPPAASVKRFLLPETFLPYIVIYNVADQER